MNLIQLPEEILILIVKKLDFNSQFNLSETCSYLSNIVTLFGVLKKCKISPGPLASPDLFKRDFFKSIAGQLKELNLCAVRSLTKSAFLPAVRKLKCLETLDISYTNINIPDLVDIKEACALLKNISINFSFGKWNATFFNNPRRIEKEVLVKCQEIFQYFENVEFVGICDNLMYSQLPLYLLQKAYLLNEVKFTVIKSDHAVYESEKCDLLFKFNQLQLLFLPWHQIPTSYSRYAQGCPLIFRRLKMTKIEYIIILLEDQIMHVQKFYSSAVFESFFEEHFGEPSSRIDNLHEVDLTKNVIFLLWNKDTTTFDDLFFSKLWIKIKGLLPSLIPTSGIYKSQPAPKNVDWHFIFVEYSDVLPRRANVDPEEPLAKKKRVGLINHVLDFDDYLKDTNHSLKLTLQFILSPTVCLNPATVYLRKLTYLSLMGRVRFSKDFFKVLFQCCENLETLNVEPTLFPCAISIANSIPLSSSLKNFRLAKKIEDNNLNVLLSSISNCKLIENIHIFNKRVGNTELNDLSFIVAKCANLYSLYIRNIVSYNSKMNTLRLLNEAKKKYMKPYLNLELYNELAQNNKCYLGDSYDPYIDVFKLNPLKRI